MHAGQSHTEMRDGRSLTEMHGARTDTEMHGEQSHTEMRDGRIHTVMLGGRSWRKYKLALLFAVFCSFLLLTLFLSNPPVVGVMERGSSKVTAPTWTFTYFSKVSAADNPNDLRKLLEQEVFSAGPAGIQAAAGLQPAPRSFFPVWDGTMTEADFAQRFPHIPEDQLPGYGRTAYFVDYGEARFWFLNAARLAEEPAAQLDWLSRTAADNPPLHRIVLLQQEPAQPEVWDRLAASGTDLVLAGARAYAPETAVTARPQAGYRSSAHPGWAEWTLSSSPSGLLKVQGQGSRLEAALPLDGAGRAADRLVLDAAALRQPAAVQERAPLSIGAMWRYRAGGPDVRAEVPPGLDLSGETPDRGQPALTRDDWRSPGYDDAGWTWAPAPFGRSADSTRSRGIRTPLAAQPQSPVYYFRKTFVLDENPAEVKEWLLHAAYEDGFVAYLNGVEIARDSIQEGLVDSRSLALPHEGGLFDTIPVSNHRNVLVQGVNTLAVEVHTSHPDSPEMWFDLSLSYKK
jgi:hypothetical protein